MKELLKGYVVIRNYSKNEDKKDKVYAALNKITGLTSEPLTHFNADDIGFIGIKIGYTEGIENSIEDAVKPFGAEASFINLYAVKMLNIYSV